jgi:hypothetical protein
MNRYWLIWLCTLFATFAVPETIAIVRNRTQDTLSGWTWRHCQVIVHQPIDQWSATHFLFAGIVMVLAVWGVGHLVLGIWT